MSVSCTVWEGWNKLVHSGKLHCSHLRISFLIFMLTHPLSWQTGSLLLLWIFDGRQQRRLLRRSYNYPIWKLSALVIILHFILVISMYIIIIYHILYFDLLPYVLHLSDQYLFSSSHSCTFLSKLVVTEHFFYWILESPCIKCSQHKRLLEVIWITRSEWNTPIYSI